MKEKQIAVPVALTLVSGLLIFTLVVRGAGADPTVLAKAEAVGKMATSRLVQSLSGQLKAALEAGDAATAIAACSQIAPNTTRAVAGELPMVVSVSRTSTKYRDPANRPTEQDAEVLQRFEEQPVNARKGFAARIEEGGHEYFAYYHPIVVNPVCLKCHGAPESFSPSVAEALARLYPEDLATGYEPGALRGMVKVLMDVEAMSGPGRFE